MKLESISARLSLLPKTEPSPFLLSDTATTLNNPLKVKILMVLKKNLYLRFWLAGLVVVFWLSIGRLALAVDWYEPDDTYGQATTITTNGVTQTHDFDPAGDNDWVKFSAVDGDSYVIETSNLGVNCNTFIELYDTDGTTVLDDDDDSGEEPMASRIIWTASGPDTYYVMAGHYSSSVGGTDTNYDISITTFLPGSISGTVTTTGGTPLPVIFIIIYDSNWNPLDIEFTDIDGNYNVDGLPTGKYYVEAWDLEGVYADEYYDDVTETSQATLVSVTEGEDTGNIDFDLFLPGSISGAVTIAGGTIFSGIRIAVYDSDWDWVGSTDTDIFGYYSIGGLLPGSYYINAYHLNKVYFEEYYDDVTELELATPVIVTEGEDTGNINFDLVLTGWISGTVTSTGGTPLPNIDIYVYASDWIWVNRFNVWDYTDANGNYIVGGLTTGNYYVRVWDWSGVFFDDYAYVSEYYDDVIERSQATSVSVIFGEETPNINFELTLGGLISGTIVSDADGSPISDILLWAIGYNSNENIGSSTFTSTDGKYVIKGLPTGGFRVWAQTAGIFGLSGTDYASEFYKDILNYQDATPVSVTAGTNTPDINFRLAAGGSISGAISYSGSQTGMLIVGAFPASSYTPFWPVSMTEIYPPGSYSFKGIPSGEWYIAAYIDLNQDFKYNSGEPFGEYICNPVLVIAGYNTANIDLVLNGEAGVCEVGDGCSCVTVSSESSQYLEIDQMIGFLLPFAIVFLAIIILIRRGKKRIEISLENR